MTAYRDEISAYISISIYTAVYPHRSRHLVRRADPRWVDCRPPPTPPAVPPIAAAGARTGTIATAGGTPRAPGCERVQVSVIHVPVPPGRPCSTVSTGLLDKEREINQWAHRHDSSGGQCDPALGEVVIVRGTELWSLGHRTLPRIHHGCHCAANVALVSSFKIVPCCCCPTSLLLLLLPFLLLLPKDSAACSAVNLVKQAPVLHLHFWPLAAGRPNLGPTVASRSCTQKQVRAQNTAPWNRRLRCVVAHPPASTLARFC